MRGTRLVLLFIAGVGTTPFASAQSGGGFDQDWKEFTGSGAAASGGGFSLVGVAGPSAEVAGGSFAHDAGFVRGLCGGTIETYGAGCPGSGGFVPALAMSGCPATGYDLVFEISGGLGGSFASIYLGLGAGVVPLGGGCSLLLTPLLPGAISPLPLFGAGPGNGAITLPTTVPQSVPAVVLPVTLQVLIADPGSPSGTGLSATNGVKLTLN